MCRLNLLVLLFNMFFLQNLFSQQQLTLEDYISIVKSNNFDIKLSTKDVESAEKNIDYAWTNLLPQISANVNAKHYLKNSAPLFTKNEINGDIQLSQSIFDLSKIKSIQNQRDIYQAEYFYSIEKKQEVILKAKKAYYITILLREALKLKEETEKLAKKHFNFVKDKYENGLVNEFEYLQAKLQWKKNQPDVLNAKRDYILSINNLKDFAGISDSVSIEVVGNLELNSTLPNWPETDNILNNRNDFKALLWNKKSVESEISTVKAEFLPSLDGFLAYNNFRNKTKYETNSYYNITAGLSLNIPILYGGNRFVRLEKLSIQKEKSFLAINKFKQLLVTELMGIYEKLKVAKENLKTSLINLEVAEKAYELATISYESGLVKQLDLAETRNSLFRTKIDYLMSSYEFLTSTFDWDKALGTLK